MIRKILTTYAARLDEYLARSHRQPEGVAEVGLIGSAGEQCPNKLVVSLVNLEREASGDGGYMQRAATGYAGRRQPLLLNMHIMMAAVYEDKRYAEALSVLSDALTFIQSLPRFEVGNESYTLELVPMSNDLINRKDQRIDTIFKGLENMERMIDAIRTAPRPAFHGDYFLTDEELSKLLKVSRRTLQEYRTLGVIPYYLIQGKALYKESDIKKVLDDAYKRCRKEQRWV